MPQRGGTPTHHPSRRSSRRQSISSPNTRTVTPQGTAGPSSPDDQDEPRRKRSRLSSISEDNARVSGTSTVPQGQLKYHNLDENKENNLRSGQISGNPENRPDGARRVSPGVPVDPLLFATGNNSITGETRESIDRTQSDNSRQLNVGDRAIESDEELIILDWSDIEASFPDWHWDPVISTPEPEVVENSEEQSGIQSWINNGRITGSVDEQRTICENNLPSQDEGVAGTELGHQTLQPLTLQMLEDHPEYLPHALFIGTECYMYEGPPIIVPIPPGNHQTISADQTLDAQEGALRLVRPVFDRSIPRTTYSGNVITGDRVEGSSRDINVDSQSTVNAETETERNESGQEISETQRILREYHRRVTEWHTQGIHTWRGEGG